MRVRTGSVYAIIPARSGSTSVKDKNIRILGGHPMIAYSIAVAKLVDRIERTIVSTDSHKYAEIAKQYGADVPFIRPAEISGPLSTDLEFIEHVIDWLGENEGEVPEYWVHLRPTTPFRDPELVADAINQFTNDPFATSLRSAHLTDLCPYKWFKLNSKGYYETFCGLSHEDANGPRQRFPATYVPDGYVDIIKTDYVMKNRKLHGDKVLAFESPPTIDVDYEHDFEDLEKTVGEYIGPVKNWLQFFQTNG